MKSCHKTLMRGSIVSLLVITTTFLFVACGGNTSGDGSSGDGTAFNDSDGNAGGIRLEIIDDSLSVADTTGFRVHVVDAQGDKVANIEIACDTEQGLALLEPTTGYELTSVGGEISGRVGCETPGSYQIGCRLPIGGNKRALHTITCQGPIPDGFTGFPGAGGGSLGLGGSPGSGGAVPPASSGSLRITDVTLSENSKDTLSVDVQQGVCGTTAETFTDTLAKFAVKNETSEPVNFSSFSYEVSGSSGSGTFYSSTELAFSVGSSIAANSSATLTGLFLRAHGAGIKSFTGSSAAISPSLGFRNVTFTLFGTTASGKSISVQASIGTSFGNFNKC